MSVEEKLELFGILRLVCGVLAIMLLLLAIFLFWKLNIWQVLRERTGIAKKKSMSIQQERNAVTSQLKSNAEQLAAKEFSAQLAAEKKRERRRNTSEIRRHSGEIQPTPAPMQEDRGTEVLQEQATTVLSEQNTTVLQEQGTTVLSAELQQKTQPAAPPVYYGKFVLTMNQQYIHTNEEIPEDYL